MADHEAVTQLGAPGPVLPGTMQPVSIGGYRILRRIGEGGMGVVYEAEQRYPQRPVALKVIRAAASADAYQILPLGWN